MEEPIAIDKGESAPKMDVVKAMQTAAIAKDWELFKSFFADQVYYRVGNVKEVTGPEGVATYLRDLPSIGLAITRMDVRGAWEAGEVAIAEYTMQGIETATGRVVEYPCVDLYRFEGDRCIDWRVYAIESMFVAERSLVGRGRPLEKPREQEGSQSASHGILGSFQAALRDGDSGTALALLTDDALVKVANQPEVRGKQAILDHIQEVFARRIRPVSAEVLDTWEFGEALLVEMIVRANRVADGRTVQYGCVESYRFEGGKIREWRIYPMEAALLVSKG